MKKTLSISTRSPNFLPMGSFRFLPRMTNPLARFGAMHFDLRTTRTGKTTSHSTNTTTQKQVKDSVLPTKRAGARLSPTSSPHSGSNPSPNDEPRPIGCSPIIHRSELMHDFVKSIVKIAFHDAALGESAFDRSELIEDADDMPIPDD